MLHTKFQGHRPFGSGEEDFLQFLPYMGMAAILVMWPGPFEQIFHSPIPEKLHMKFDWLAQWFQRRICLKSVDNGQTDEWWTTEAYLSYKLNMSLWLTWANHNNKSINYTSLFFQI